MLFLRRLFILLAVFVVLLCSSQLSYASNLQHLTGTTMGQSYRISWPANELPSEQFPKLKRSLSGTLTAIDGTMSTWREQSELSRINATKHDQAIQLTEHTAVVIKKALLVGKQTDGALDITIGPLLKLWGFGPHKSNTTPSASQLQRVSHYVGLDKIELKDKQLRKLDPRVELDLSAIAKGYGVDMAAAVLERYGIENYLVEIGGEVRAKGTADNAKPWQVAVNQPAVYSQTTAAVLTIADHAVATSGDYRQFYNDQGGQRYSHIVDPKTGDAKIRDVASATVIATDCASADGLATALMVMGIDKAMAFAEQQQIPALLIGANDGEFSLHYSSAMNKFISP